MTPGPGSSLDGAAAGPGSALGSLRFLSWCCWRLCHDTPVSLISGLGWRPRGPPSCKASLPLGSREHPDCSRGPRPGRPARHPHKAFLWSQEGAQPGGVAQPPPAHPHSLGAWGGVGWGGLGWVGVGWGDGAAWLCLPSLIPTKLFPQIEIFPPSHSSSLRVTPRPLYLVR